MGPDLLNDDGSASMATALMMSHHGFRRDLGRFAQALRQVKAGEHGRVEALKEEWPRFHATLHGHHEAEDNNMFPHMRGQQEALAPIIDGLGRDHRHIDPLLAEGDRAFAGLPDTAGDAAGVVHRLSELLTPHLATEETHIIPLIRAAKTFPPPATEAEAEMFAQGFAWASHGIAEDVLAKLDVMLPENLRAKLPAARAAFAERCLRVWGPTTPRAARTSDPDWLRGG